VSGKIDKRTQAVLESFGEHVRRSREERGVAQAALAQAIGMDPTNLAKIERGKVNVTADTMRRIAEGLGLEVVLQLGAAKKGR
jgi:ribosome-binding protein aMBF1 (putative translation factor)